MSTPEIETEANYFAMHLLVPADRLRAELEKIGGVDLADDKATQLRKLARRFGVSETVMAFRIAEECGL